MLNGVCAWYALLATTTLEMIERNSQLLFTDCQRKTSKMDSSAIPALNAELDAILQKNDVEVERFLRNYIYREYFRRFVKWFLVAISILCAIYWVPILNWNASAVGRLFLIKLVLPFYNWENWANARCLIEWSEPPSTVEEYSIDSNSVSPDECSTCENLCKCFVAIRMEINNNSVVHFSFE